ncbi:glycosyl hydrolase family 28-related protein [Streptomyces mirabilis]|uniref:glycosyl hydrolase family 28-related protein n=1 Tax=Streptomyces mirabilis TaxID=68239 RepID=UPI003824F485
MIGFYGPDGVTNLYLDFGFAGGRVLMQASDLGASVTDLQANKVDRSELPSLNVKTTGATGNGVADDTTAIQSAINQANTAGGGVVYFPAGTYKLTSALTIYSKVHLVGDGQTVSKLNQTSTSANAITGTDLLDVSITKLRVTGPGSGTGNGIYLTRSSADAGVFFHLEDVFVEEFGADGIYLSQPVVSTISRVISQSNGGHGFNLKGGDIAGGASTSLHFSACFANSNDKAGYHFDTVVYTSLTGCAADANGIGYEVTNLKSQSISFNGCGCESPANNSTSYPGIGWKIDGAYGIGLYNCWVYNAGVTGIWVTGNSHTISLVGCTDNTPSITALNFVKVDSGSFVTMIDCSNTSPNSLVTGTTSVLNDGAGNLSTKSVYSAGTITAEGDFTSFGGKITAAGGVGVGNSASASTLGILSKKMEVFDASGASLGFVPIYTTIT